MGSQTLPLFLAALPSPLGAGGVVWLVWPRVSTVRGYVPLDALLFFSEGGGLDACLGRVFVECRNPINRVCSREIFMSTLSAACWGRTAGKVRDGSVVLLFICCSETEVLGVCGLVREGVSPLGLGRGWGEEGII